MQGNITYPDYLSSSLINLLMQMFQMNPKSRISIDMINTHPWLTSERPRLLEIAPIISKDVGVDKSIVKLLVNEGFNQADVEESIKSKKRNYTSASYYLYKSKIANGKRF